MRRFDAVLPTALGRPVLAATLALAVPATLAAQAAEPLGDFLPGRGFHSSVQPSEFTAFDGSVLFAASDPLHGHELRLWDGESVRLFEDLWPGPGSSVPGEIVPAGLGTVFLRAFERTLGSELWRVDREGRARVLTDLCPGPCSGVFTPLFRASFGLIFAGAEASPDWEPWITDGSAAGTLRLADVRPGPLPSFPKQFTEIAEVVYFTAFGEDRFELWVTDGTPAAPGGAGTRRVFSTCRGCSGSIGNLTAWRGRLYFTASEEGGGAKLWVTDGTIAGTREVADPGEGIAVRRVTPFDGFLYLVTNGTPNGWRTDGVGNGAPAAELFPGGAVHRLQRLVTVGNRLFATAEVQPPSVRLELWTLARAGSPAVRLTDAFQRGPSSLSPFGDRLVFEAGTPAFGREPWVSDGTVAGTHLLADLVPGAADSTPFGFTAIGERLFFSAIDEAGREPWVSDGTAAGTRRIADVDRPPFAGFDDELVRLGDRLYFVEDSGAANVLWTTDGTAAGTGPVMRWSHLSWLRAGGERLYLSGRTQDGQFGLYALDGSAGGTELLLTEGVTPPVSALGEVYFSTTDHGQELWASDGSAAGTRRIVDIHPGYSAPCPPPIICSPFSDYPRGFAGSRGVLYFTAFAEGEPPQLWKSDGRFAGTAPVRGFPGSQGLQQLTPHGDGVLFTVTEASETPDLWFSDGSADGTRPLEELLPGPVPQAPRLLTRFGDRTVVIDRTQLGGDELWIVEASPLGARRLSDLVFRGRISQARAPFVAGDLVYLPVYHPASGSELWVSDGTAEGTGLLANLAPGRTGSYPQPLAFAAGRLYFAADDGITGLELWATDGTAAGTARVDDLAPGGAASSPGPAAAVGSRLVFFADDGERGREPWALDLTLEPPPEPSPGGGASSPPARR